MASPIDLGISCGIIPPTYDDDGVTLLPQYGSCLECPNIVFTQFKKLETPRQAYDIEFLDDGRWQVEELVGDYITEEPIAGLCRIHKVSVQDFKKCPECKFLESYRKFKAGMMKAEEERTKTQMNELVEAGRNAAAKRLTFTGGA